MQSSIWEEARSVSILSIADRLGIVVEKNTALCFKGHDKKTRSLNFSDSKNLWHCFGCGGGGGTIELVVACLGFTPIEAAKWIAGARLGNGIRHRSSLTATNNRTKSETSNGSPIQVADHEVYSDLLRRFPIKDSGISYLKGRGYSKELIASLQFGQVESPNETYVVLRRTWGYERLMTAGLIRIVDKPDSIKSRFLWWDDTLVIPFRENGHIKYLQGRRLGSGDPRYVNLVGVAKPLFNISCVSGLPDGATVHICEGVTDTLTAMQLGWNAVGTLGAQSFRQEWAFPLMRFRIVVVPDDDAGGYRFYQSVKKAFLKNGKQITALRIGDGRDLTEHSNLKKK